MKSKIIISLIFLVVVVILGLVLFWVVPKLRNNKLNQTAKPIVSHEFDGTSSEIKDNILSVQGSFIDATSNKAIITSADNNKTVTIQISISTSTKITRTGLIIPSAEELKATNGRIDMDKLKTEESDSDLETLKKDISQGGVGIFAKSAPDKNIFGQMSFEATEINYRVGIYK